jgi:hypothetical protein
LEAFEAAALAALFDLPALADPPALDFEAGAGRAALAAPDVAEVLELRGFAAAAATRRLVPADELAAVFPDVLPRVVGVALAAVLAPAAPPVLAAVVLLRADEAALAVAAGFLAAGAFVPAAARGEAFLRAVFVAPDRPFGAVRRLEPGALRVAITFPFVTGARPWVTLTVSGK